MATFKETAFTAPSAEVIAASQTAHASYCRTLTVDAGDEQTKILAALTALKGARIDIWTMVNQQLSAPMGSPWYYGYAQAE